MNRRQPRPHPRRPELIAAAVCGLVVAVGLPVGWWVTHQGESPTTTINAKAFTALAAPTPTSPETSPTSAANPASEAATTPTTPLPIVPIVTGTPPAPLPIAVPVRLQIPAARIDAPVEVEGVTASGDMQLPEPVGDVGWYRFGPAPGATAGAIVIAGHVDSAQQGEGALFQLRTLTAGATITLTTQNGRRWHYTVIAREEFAKRTIPLAQIFTRTGAPHLTIITCGGTFDRAALSYDDNIVVIATAA